MFSNNIKNKKSSTKFDELFVNGVPKSSEDNNNTVFIEWNKFHEASNQLIEETMNRKPIVDFKINKSKNNSEYACK